MSIITPSDTALAYLAQLTIGQQRFDISEQSDTTGHTATRLGGPPRWTASLRTLDAMEPAISALWKAITLQLRGRIDHLALWDITQPVPRGTARGTITLASTAAAGASSLSLAGCTNRNLLLGGNFEIDSNADGLADGWTVSSAGTTGAVTHAVVASVDIHGAKIQRVAAAALGATSGDFAGIQRIVSVASLVGQPLTFSFYGRKSSGGPDFGLQAYMSWMDGGGSAVGTDSQTTATPSGAWVRYSVTATVPAGAASVRVWMLMRQAATAGAVSMDIDAAQLEVASTVGEYAGAATLAAGDWLQIGSGVGSHYCMVTADATANDAGVMSVSIQPPTRKSFSSGAAVTWDKPLGHYKQRPDSFSWSGAAGSADVGGFALDLMEDWTA